MCSSAFQIGVYCLRDGFQKKLKKVNPQFNLGWLTFCVSLTVFERQKHFINKLTPNSSDFLVNPKHKKKKNAGKTNWKIFFPDRKKNS